MIAYIKGELQEIQDESIIVDAGGVGYEVICANPFTFQSYLDKEVKVYTYHYVREDMQILYGFKHKEEKYLFIKLISVSGIGPKGALAILGTVEIDEFVAAIEREDDKLLTTFPGVGKKTARQIILDLKGKLTSFTITQEQTDSPAEPEKNTALLEANDALKVLGYTEKEIKSVSPELMKASDENTDQLVRRALALLVKN